MAQPFYDFPEFQGYSPAHDGVDIDAPAGYPVTAIESGDVVEAGWRNYGGEVAIAVPGTGDSTVTIHLDDIDVAPGQHVSAGEQIGTVGGGVGSKLLKGGRVQPATSQADFGRFSTGYHVHESVFMGQTPDEIERGWADFSRTIDPQPIIDHLRATGQPIWPGTATPGSSHTLAQTTASDSTPVLGGIQDAINALNPATWGAALEHAAGFSDLKNAMGRIVVFGLGVSLVVGGVFVAVKGDQVVVEAVKQAPKVAAKAAI